MEKVTRESLKWFILKKWWKSKNISHIFSFTIFHYKKTKSFTILTSTQWNSPDRRNFRSTVLQKFWDQCFLTINQFHFALISQVLITRWILIKLTKKFKLEPLIFSLFGRKQLVFRTCYWRVSKHDILVGMLKKLDMKPKNVS